MAKTQSLAFLLIADDLQQFPKPFNRGKVDECYAIKRQNSQIASPVSIKLGVLVSVGAASVTCLLAYRRLALRV